MPRAGNLSQWRWRGGAGNERCHGCRCGTRVGVLAGLIGLGGAEFRLPLLIGVFGFAALGAVILNKAMSLIVVLTALPVRLAVIPYDQLSPHGNIVINLLTGSLLGAWMGATAATRMPAATLYRVLPVLLALIAVVVVSTHVGTVDERGFDGVMQVIAGVVAAYLIGPTASVMSVAGGELPDLRPGTSNVTQRRESNPAPKIRPQNRANQRASTSPRRPAYMERARSSGIGQRGISGARRRGCPSWPELSSCRGSFTDTLFIPASRRRQSRMACPSDRAGSSISTSAIAARLFAPHTSDARDRALSDAPSRCRPP